MTQRVPLTLPTRPGVAFIANAGPKALYHAAEQALLPGIRSWLNIPYAMELGFRLLRLDVHVPKGAHGPVPVILFVAGGGALVVAKNFAPWEALVAEGYAVVSIEYRLSGEALFPAQVHDVKAAIRWVRANAKTYGFDSDRIAGWGCSAGGTFVAMAAVTQDSDDFEGTVGEDIDQSSKVSCAIIHYGGSDLAAMGDDTNHLPGAMEPMGTATSPETRMLGFNPSEDRGRAKSVSPVTYVRSDTVPILLMHGDADTRLGQGQSERFHAALNAVGADSEYHVIPGANHGGPEFMAPEVTAKILAFLKRTL